MPQLKKKERERERNSCCFWAKSWWRAEMLCPTDWDEQNAHAQNCECGAFPTEFCAEIPASAVTRIAAYEHSLAPGDPA